MPRQPQGFLGILKCPLGMTNKTLCSLGSYGRILERQTISQFGPQNAYMSVWEGEYGHFVAVIPERK